MAPTTGAGGGRSGRPGPPRRFLARAWGAMGIVVAVSLAALFTGEASAQGVRRSPTELSLNNALRTASALYKDGHHQDVIDLLAPLLVRYPGEERVIRVLADAYAKVGEYDRAVALYRDEISRSGGRDPGMWNLLISAQREAGRCTDAVDTLLAILERNPGWVSRFTDQLELVVTDSACGRPGLAYLEQQITDADPLPPGWPELLGHAYLVLQRYEQALDLFADIDRAHRHRGQYVYNLARMLAQRGELEAAIAAYDSVLTFANLRQLREPAMFERAVLLERSGRWADAAERYEEIGKQYPDTPLGMRAELARAGLYLGPLQDLEKARDAFRAVLDFVESRPKNSGLRAIQEEARMALAECALRTGQFTEADSAYAQIERESADGTTKEQAAFARAQVLFFQGRFPEAEEAYFGITDDYVGGSWVNDAFAQALLLGEFGTRAPGQLKMLAQAAFERLRGDLDAAEALCQAALADSSQVLLRDHIRALQIELHGERAQWAEADSLLQLLLESDPHPRVAADVIFWLGREAEKDPRRWEQALQYYEDVILRYPDSFETRRARDRLRAMSREIDRS